MANTSFRPLIGVIISNQSTDVSILYLLSSFRPLIGVIISNLVKMQQS